MVGSHHFCHWRFFYFCFFLENLQPGTGKKSKAADLWFYHSFNPYFYFIETNTRRYPGHGRHIERVDPSGCTGHHVNSSYKEKIVSVLPASVVDAYNRLAGGSINDLDEYHYYSAKHWVEKLFAMSCENLNIESCLLILESFLYPKKKTQESRINKQDSSVRGAVVIHKTKKPPDKDQGTFCYHPSLLCVHSAV